MSKHETDFATASRRLKEARAALNAYDGDDYETYAELNKAVIEAEKAVPWLYR
jgi:hypothetical protein